MLQLVEVVRRHCLRLFYVLLRGIQLVGKLLQHLRRIVFHSFDLPGSFNKLLYGTTGLLAVEGLVDERKVGDAGFIIGVLRKVLVQNLCNVQIVVKVVKHTPEAIFTGGQFVSLGYLLIDIKGILVVCIGQLHERDAIGPSILKVTDLGAWVPVVHLL